jgi:hypothetical protein
LITDSSFPKDTASRCALAADSQKTKTHRMAKNPANTFFMTNLQIQNYPLFDWEKRVEIFSWAIGIPREIRFLVANGT